jgi:GNAT superfamily N-acetyltransferase
VEPTSLGYRTDLMLLALQGAEIADRGDHLVVRTPSQPDFHWGNFLLYAEPPAAGDLDRWMSAFRAEFPAAGHMTFGIDTTDGVAGEAAVLAAAGLEAEVSVVLSAAALHEPPRPARDAEVRILDGDDDWAQAIALRRSDEEAGTEPAGAEADFLGRRMDAMRALQDAGHGAWFGAFVDGRMVSGLGVFSDGGGTARYQSVDTHRDARGRGLAGTLVHHAGRYAVEELGARTLVIVADLDSQAERIYRSVGFAGNELVPQLARPGP